MEYENRYVMDLKTLQEFSKVASQTSRNIRNEGFVLAIIFASMLILGVVENMGGKFIGLAIIGLLICVVFFKCDIWQGKRLLNKRMKAYNGEIPETIYTFDDKIHFQEGEIALRYAYKTVLEFRESENCFFLMMDKENCHIIRKDGFTVGTAEDFKEEMIEKIDNTRYSLGMKPQSEMRRSWWA